MEVNRRRLFEVVGGAAFVGAAVFLYTCGERNGERNTEARVLDAKNDLKAQLGQKEDELRQCTNRNAQLQAVLQLKDADRNRLLELTTVEPPLRLTYEGKALKGKVDVATVPNQPCVKAVFWMENTGSRDVRVEGGEILTEAPYEYSPQVQPLSEGGAVTYRHWINFVGVITPGGRRWSEFGFCKGREPMRDGEEIAARAAIFAEGFLSTKTSFTVVVRFPKDAGMP